MLMCLLLPAAWAGTHEEKGLAIIKEADERKLSGPTPERGLCSRPRSDPGRYAYGFKKRGEYCYNIAQAVAEIE